MACRPRRTARCGERSWVCPGAVIRLNPGSNPPETALAEVYEPPFNNPNAKIQGYSPRGFDIDRNGVAWLALASGHMASFDRRKCKGPLNGPNATGQHCPEGWTLYPEPVPQFKGVTDSGSAEASYYTWVDQFDTLGLGRNMPDQHRQCSRRAAGPEGRQVGGPSRSVSDRVLHEMAGRPDRRSERRMEGQGTVEHGQYPQRRSTWKRAEAPRAKSSGSSFVPIRSRSDLSRT